MGVGWLGCVSVGGWVGGGVNCRIVEVSDDRIRARCALSDGCLDRCVGIWFPAWLYESLHESPAQPNTPPRTRLT